MMAIFTLKIIDSDGRIIDDLQMAAEPISEDYLLTQTIRFHNMLKERFASGIHLVGVQFPITGAANVQKVNAVA